jgi:hypothetical protein
MSEEPRGVAGHESWLRQGSCVRLTYLMTDGSAAELDEPHAMATTDGGLAERARGAEAVIYFKLFRDRD